MVLLNIPKKNSQSGQAGIIILLIMVVLLTLGLSLASRTTQEIFLSQQQSESSRVFNAAETGIEYALTEDFEEIESDQLFTLPEGTIENIDVAYSIMPSNSLETRVDQGSSVMVRLNGQNTPLTIRWVPSDHNLSCDEQASLIASVYYQDGPLVAARHIAFGPNRSALGCSDNEDNFIRVFGGGGSYALSYSLLLNAEDLLVRIRPVYNSAHIQIGGATTAQIHTIRSDASNQIGDEFRSIQVGRTMPNPPSFMDYALYSGNQILKP